MLSPRPQVHRTALDGVRALAILCVMLVHVGFPGARAGWIGVDIFFVLSGFLITTLLAMEIDATGRIDWPAFMIRRSLRLMPAYFLYAALMTAAIWAWPGSERAEVGGWNAAGLTVAMWTYVLNFVPQGGIWNGQGMLVHLWSLAVEQQYYLVWPPLLGILVKRPGRQVVFTAGLAAVCATMFVLWPPGLYKSHMLWTRGFSLIAASAMALHCVRSTSMLSRPMLNRGINIVGVVALAALVLLPYRPGWDESRTTTVVLPILVPVFAFWFARLWYLDSGSIANTFLQNPVLVYVGKVSYGIYLYHELVRMAVWYVARPLTQAWTPGAGFAVRLVLYLLFSFMLAALSYELFEKRALRLAARFRPKRVAAVDPQAAS